MTTEKETRQQPSQQQPHATPLPRLTDAPLSPHWAFVVQFRAAPGGAVYPAGRVEHLPSGRTVHFQSLQELTAYFEGELQVSKGV
jgi:hypothetical protein